MRQGSAFVAFVLFAGCGFDHGQSGSRPQDAREIDAPTIDAAVIDGATTDTMTVVTDAAVDAMTTTDTDGDGVADTTDNCPTVANTNQRDHDGDLHGDVCDRCPHLASTPDPDGDSDGVGDACDPRPSTAGDSIALFEGFYDTNSIANWNENGNGTWIISNGVLSQTSSSTSTTTHTLAPPGTFGRAAITAGVRVIALGSGSMGFETPAISVATGVDNNQAYWCSVVDEGNSDKIYASIQRPMMFPQFPDAPWPGTFTTNSELRITSALVGANNVCTVVQGSTTATASGAIGAATGGVQVATRTAAASFDYVFVVSVGN
jgi:hypothetical protein